jgi:LysM domain
MATARAEEGRLPLSAPVSFLRGADAAAAVCPFLGALDDVGVLGDAVPVFDQRNRCTAYGPWQPIGQLQQELVCLTVAHTACPRYTRGMRYGPGGPRQQMRRRAGILVTTLAAIAAVAIALALVVGGNLSLDTLTAFLPAAPTPTVSAVPSPTPPTTPGPTPEPTGAAPTATPEVTPSETTPSDLLPTPPPGSPYASLAPCPDGQLCYLYTVKSGDTLSGIAARFGTTVSAIRALNPAVATTSLIHVGQTLKLPPP